MRQKMKPTLWTLLYYAAAISLVAFLETTSPGGPCTPGLGALAFLALIPVTFVLLIFSIHKTTVTNKRYLLPLLMHLTAIVSVVVIL